MNEGSKGLKGDDYIHLEMDFDWDSRQDVELDVSPIPGIPFRIDWEEPIGHFKSDETTKA